MASLNRCRLSFIPFGLPAGLPEAPFVNCTFASDVNSKSVYMYSILNCPYPHYKYVDVWKVAKTELSK